MSWRSASLLSIAIAVCLSACGSAPSPTPGDILDIRDELALRGVTVVSAVAGDSACPSQPLTDNALHLRVTTVSDVEPRDVYLYLFRARDFAATADQVGACLAEYRGLIGTTPAIVEIEPYRAIGRDWSDVLRQAIAEALTAAAR